MPRTRTKKSDRERDKYKVTYRGRADLEERANEMNDVDRELSSLAFPDVSPRAALDREMFIEFLSALRPYGKRNTGARSVMVYLTGHQQLAAFYMARKNLIFNRQSKPNDPMSRVVATIIEDYARILGMWNRGELVKIGEVEFKPIQLEPIEQSESSPPDGEPGETSPASAEANAG